jgi:DNA modification methylase
MSRSNTLDNSIRHRARITAAGEISASASDRLRLVITYRNPKALTANAKNARKHPKKQIVKLAAGMRQFGFLSPVLVNREGVLVAGHGRVQAAIMAEIAEIPTICLEHLSPEEQRAFMLADNRLSSESSWDRDLLKAELAELSAADLSFDLELTGFDTGEVDIIIDPITPADKMDPADQVPELPAPNNVVSRLGDLWLLGDHRLFCGDANIATGFKILLGDERAQMGFADAPYNVKVKSIGGKGRIRHEEFKMASGEMSKAEFTAFLKSTFGNMAAHSVDGAIHFQCMDWRHMGEMLAAGEGVYSELKNLCVWNKDNAGMGTFFRSKHELIFVWKVGTAPHINNFGLGEKGRYRTNVWDYGGISGLSPNRMDELAMHPTVKPLALVADAIRDCSKRGGIILDAFCGSGTTLIAAHRTGRRGYGMELDPRYVDTAIRRWEKVSGETARLSETGQTLAELAAERGIPTAAV